MKRVFIIILCLCTIFHLSACTEQSTVKPEERIVMVNDKLYYGASKIGPMGDSECVDGQIVSSVEKDKIPTQNGQSNFGCIGNSFTKDEGDGGIMVFIQEQWFWFYAKN